MAAMSTMSGSRFLDVYAQVAYTLKKGEPDMVVMVVEVTP